MISASSTELTNVGRICSSTSDYNIAHAANFVFVLYRILQVELLLSISAFMVALGALWTGVRLAVDAVI
jgi:hypothetical protein